MMKYKIKPSATFKRELKKMKNQKKDLSLLQNIVNSLAAGEQLPEKYNDHELKGNYRGYRECHIQPDWLLIYQIDNGNLLLYLLHTGSHSELFRK